MITGLTDRQTDRQTDGQHHNNRRCVALHSLCCLGGRTCRVHV